MSRPQPKRRSSRRAKASKPSGRRRSGAAKSERRASGLEDYRAKREFGSTPEPRGGGPGSSSSRFVIQEHHARRLHWDLRIEHEGVLASWALPKGIPLDPKQNRLAVRTEDHPLEYIDFEGEIPAGQYGAGKMAIWDHGHCELEKFEDAKVVVVLSGERVAGRYALFATKGDDWMIHRMDAPVPGREPMPERIEPMRATLAKRMPRDEDDYAYEIKWDGVRAIAYCRGGGVELRSRNMRDISAQYPEVRRMGRELGAREAVIDGELVAFDDDGRPSFQRLQGRMHVKSESTIRRRSEQTPVTYVAFDLLYLDGEVLFDLPYARRRAALESLGLDGPNWQTPSHHVGDGAALREASLARGLEGIIAKRLDSTYAPGRRSRAWLKLKNVRGQEVVVGGWMQGKGRRSGEVGALLVGYHERQGADADLRYAGRVGTGFSEQALRLLAERLEPLRTHVSPFSGRQPPRDAIFVEPRLVCEVEFSEWTASGTLRQPSYKGLRDDKDAADVVREQAS